MRTTAVCTAMARTQLEMLAIFRCFNLTRGKKVLKITKLTLTLTSANCQLVSNRQGCYRYFPKVSPMFDINAGFKSIVDTDIDTLP